jgi:uncharacterized protein (DUF1800 family)
VRPATPRARFVEEAAGLRPEEALLPFRPGADGSWDRPAAAHLVRRAAFGMGEAFVERALSLGPRAAAEDLLVLRPELEDARFAHQAALRLSSLEAAQSAWVYRMVRGSSPAREKLALFWHGHFATSNHKVENASLLLRQVDLFRERGSGPFEDLLLEVARDPAMLIWLDGNLNRRGKPNENFARELMELFSLGIGNYGEEDIKEAARAFTGWHVREGKFWFNERAHDGEPKRVFGTTGSFGGEEVARLCAARPACAEFVAQKLFEFYVHPAPGPALRRELGRAYERSGKRTGEFLASLLSSRIFHAPAARRALVASPADYAVGSLRTLAASAGAASVARAMAGMGQDLLAPPSVKGWDPGQAWLSSGTLLERYRFAEGLAVGGAAGKDLNADVPWQRIGTDSQSIIGRFFPEGLPAPIAGDLIAGAAGDPKALVAGSLQLPEYQFV